MRIQTYRDASRSRHFDLVGRGVHPWSVDLVSIGASGFLVIGFVCAVTAMWAG
jgi:hypothetical protein